MTRDTLEQRQYERGYREQMMRLRTGQASLADAIHAQGSLSQYDAGAQAATEDYVEGLERAH